jgi:hypothetical protein
VTDEPADPTPLVIDQAGNVGIGTASPGFKLDVNGIVNGTDIYKNGAPLSSIPTGAVMFFSLSGCPAGWSPYAAAQGRYVVGGSSSIGSTVGTALSSLENRPVGQHTHTASSSTAGSHSHTVTGYIGSQVSAPPYMADIRI